MFVVSIVKTVMKLKTIRLISFYQTSLTEDNMIKKKVEVRDLCSECYVDIKNYIHNKVFNRFKKEEESK